MHWINRSIFLLLLVGGGVHAAAPETSLSVEPVAEQATDATTQASSGMPIFVMLFVLAILFVVGSATAMHYLTGAAGKRGISPLSKRGDGDDKS